MMLLSATRLTGRWAVDRHLVSESKLLLPSCDAQDGAHIVACFCSSGDSHLAAREEDTIVCCGAASCIKSLLPGKHAITIWTSCEPVKYARAAFLGAGAAE